MILLSILKFILWLILGLLGLIVFVVTLILFMPISYRIKGDIQSTTVNTDIYLSWLFRIFQFRKSEEISYFKILGIKIKKKKKKKTDSPKSSGAFKTSLENSKISKDKTTESSSKSSEPSGKKPETKEASSSDNENEEDKNGMIPKIQAIIDKIKSFINYPHREEITKHTINCIKKLYYKNKPKKLTINGEIGFAYPDTTGKALAVVGIVNSFLPLNLDIQGNFEEEILKGNIEIQGHLMLWWVLWPLVEYIRKKPVWKIVRKVIFKNKSERNEEVYV